MVNDDGLIDYLVSSGYDYDTDTSSWIHSKDGTEAVLRERTAFLDGDRGDRFRGFEKAMTTPPKARSYRGELSEVSRDADELIDTIKSLKSVREQKQREDEIKLGVRIKFDPLIRKEGAVDKSLGVIDDNIRDKLRDIRTDAEVYGKSLREAKTRDELDAVKSDMGRIVDVRDKVRLGRILAGATRKADKRVTDIFNLREQARALVPEEIELGRQTVKSFAKRHGWNTKKEADLEEVRGILRTKGFNISSPTGIRRVEKFKR